MVPANSAPSTNGRGGCVWYFPCDCKIYFAYPYVRAYRGRVEERRTSKKLSPALYTLIRSSSEPGVKTGSGASHVSWSLDGCAYSLMTNAFIDGFEG